MAARRMAQLWEERLGAAGAGRAGSSVGGSSAGSGLDDVASLSPVSPRRRARLAVPRGVSADKPPIAPPLAASGRPTEVVEEPLAPDHLLRLSPVSSFTSGGSASPTPFSPDASAAAHARRRKDLAVLQVDLDVLDRKIDALDAKVARLADRVNAL